MKSLSRIIGVCAALGLGAQTWNMQAATTAPALTQVAVADSYVRDGSYAAKNFGSSATLDAKTVNYSSYTRQIFLKFDLSALTSGSNHVKLRLFGGHTTGASSSTTESVHGVNSDSWTEAGLTWNNHPAVGTALASDTISSSTAGWYEWDVTSFVLARKAAGSQYATLAVSMDTPPAVDDGYDTFNSRHASTNQPQLVFSQEVARTTVAVSPSADSYVRDGSYAGANYGADDSLVVKKVDYTGYSRQAYVKFDLSKAPGNFQKVVVRLYGSRDPSSIVTTTTAESVYGTGSSWSEDTVNWSNGPVLGSKLATTTVSGQAPQWYEWDVTDYVTSQLNAGATSASLAVAMDAMPANAESYDVFQSRETANGPQLVFTVPATPSTNPTPTPTPSPTATPTPVPTATPTPTTTPRPTATPTPVPTATPTPTTTPRPTATPTPVPTATPTATPVSTPVATPTPVASGSGTTFYVDASTGNDSNSGLSTSSAWKTLAPVNATTFDAGDRILFRSGTRYTGHLQLHGSGTSTAPISVSSYGTGVLPAIDGNGLTETLLLLNEQDWEINNLEITNTGATAVAGRNGVLIELQDYGVAHHIVLNNLYVHDVNGSIVKKGGGGQAIYLVASGANRPSSFNDLQVKNCRIVHCDRTGINMYNDHCYHDSTWNPSLKVLIDNNTLQDIGGDGIVVIGCNGAVVQNNVLKGGRTRSQDSAAGMWPWSSDNTVFQFNEVSGMVGLADGEAFDCDYNCQGTIFQYNYSHDNEGGFMLMCNNGNQVAPQNIGSTGSIVRYNISQNDTWRSFQIIGHVTNAQIYNNVIYTSPGVSQLCVVRYDTWGAGLPANITFSNNIFYGTSNSIFKWNGGTPPTFTHNCFYGVFYQLPTDTAMVTTDPQFVSPGTGSNGWETVTGYKLKNSSPCIARGAVINGNGGFDFWGVTVDSTAPNLGADNR